jgi:hypothetical protein
VRTRPPLECKARALLASDTLTANARAPAKAGNWLKTEKACCDAGKVRVGLHAGRQPPGVSIALCKPS